MIMIMMSELLSGTWSECPCSNNTHYCGSDR